MAYQRSIHEGCCRSQRVRLLWAGTSYIGIGFHVLHTSNHHCVSSCRIGGVQVALDGELNYVRLVRTTAAFPEAMKVVTGTEVRMPTTVGRSLLQEARPRSRRCAREGPGSLKTTATTTATKATTHDTWVRDGPSENQTVCSTPRGSRQQAAVQPSKLRRPSNEEGQHALLPSLPSTRVAVPSRRSLIGHAHTPSSS